jgi:exo beta-1,2-glucooligosaccharide sophorohydrolase (non-reducing end)
MRRLFIIRSFVGCVLLASPGLPSLCVAEAPVFERHVLFENSATDDSYFHSQAWVVGQSELEISGTKVPVGTDRFVSPPNCLRLKWKSATGGEWRVTLDRASRIGAALPMEGDTLVMWCYSEEEIAESDSPSVSVRDTRGRGLPDVPLLEGLGTLPAKKWVRLELPIEKFAALYSGTDEERFEVSKLAAVSIFQGLDDGREHTLFIDDIRLINAKSADREPPPAPAKLTAEGFDRHIELSWPASSASDVCSYRVYRSEDGTTFVPIDSRPSYFLRAVDFVDDPANQYSYKVSAVDVENNESPLSEAASAKIEALDDDGLLDMVQQGCFRYYWYAANRPSGMALEVLPGDDDLVALGGSGFGIVALVVATEREFIPRDQSVARMLQIVRFLKKADRFHGVWPHFLVGSTGKVWPLFGEFDDGGDLVETAFIIQGLLTARQYYDRDTPEEREIRDTITQLWREVEWDWYRKTPEGEVLYWHWSPDHAWHISHPLVGWNETMIVYLLAIASPTHAVPASMYHTGWAGQSDLAVGYRQGWSRTTHGDHYRNGHSYHGHKLDVGSGSGGDLFFAQFSFLGFDPRDKRDQFTNYFDNNRQLALINRAYCVENPRGFKGYGPDCWGLSAGIRNGGGKPQPRSDNGTICSSAALGCFPYTPDESMAVLKHLYRDLGKKTWGVYGFHDGFNQHENWFDECYMGLNQAQIVVGIENHRTGLPWKLFMSNPEVEPMLAAIGFEEDPGVNDAETVKAARGTSPAAK